MGYSRLDMLGKREQVFSANSLWGFFSSWVKNMYGKGTLYIRLPPVSKEAALQICRTVEKVSGIRFPFSSLIAYQMEEVLREQELSPNLYTLKKNLKVIADTHSINRHYEESGTALRRVKVFLPKKTIYNIEFLLANMCEELGEHDYTVEKVLELNLMDLLKEMAQGRAENTIQEILESLGVTKAEVRDYVEERGEELLA